VYILAALVMATLSFASLGQAASPLAERALIRTVGERLAAVFPRSGVYFGPVPTYPTGLWSYSWGAKSAAADLARGDPARGAALPTRYYNAAVHAGAASRPAFLFENG
jgi:spermidine synthase